MRWPVHVQSQEDFYHRVALLVRAFGQLDPALPVHIEHEGVSPILGLRFELDRIPRNWKLDRSRINQQFGNLDQLVCLLLWKHLSFVGQIVVGASDDDRFTHYGPNRATIQLEETGPGVDDESFC